MFSGSLENLLDEPCELCGGQTVIERRRPGTGAARVLGLAFRARGYDTRVPADQYPHAARTLCRLRGSHDELMVLNKPYGIAVQGGTRTLRHIDGMLANMEDRFGERPRLGIRCFDQLLDILTFGNIPLHSDSFTAGSLDFGDLITKVF